MDFKLTEEQELIRNNMREFAKKHVDPIASSTGFTLSFHAGIIGMSILLFGNEAQKEKYLVPLAMGRHLGSFALTEPGAGTDVMAVATTALHQGTNHVVRPEKLVFKKFLEVTFFDN